MNRSIIWSCGTLRIRADLLQLVNCKAVFPDTFWYLSGIVLHCGVVMHEVGPQISPCFLPQGQCHGCTWNSPLTLRIPCPRHLVGRVVSSHDQCCIQRKENKVHVEGQCVDTIELIQVEAIHEALQNDPEVVEKPRVVPWNGEIALFFPNVDFLR